MSKDHREYRDKERDRDREDRFSRSCKYFQSFVLLLTNYLLAQLMANIPVHGETPDCDGRTIQMVQCLHTEGGMMVVSN